MRGFTLILVFIGVVFAMKPGEVLELSRYNLDEALRLFQEYVMENPAAESIIDKLGKVLYSKLELSKIESISEAVLEEDFSKLLVGLKKMNYVDERTIVLLENVFPEFESRLKRRLEELEPNSMAVCAFVPVEIRVDPGEMARNLIRKFEKAPSSVDLVAFRKLKCVVNLEDIMWELEKELKDLVGLGEEKYAEVYSLMKALGMKDETFTGVEDYFRLLEEIETSNPESMTKGDYAELLNRYNALSAEKKFIKEKLVEMAKKLVERGIDLSDLCDDRELCPKFEKPADEKKGSSFGIDDLLPYIAVASAVIAVISVRYVLSKSPKRRVKKLQKRISKDPLNPDLHIELAQLYEELGMMEEAMREYNLASKILGGEKEEG